MNKYRYEKIKQTIIVILCSIVIIAALSLCTYGTPFRYIEVTAKAGDDITVPAGNNTMEETFMFFKPERFSSLKIMDNAKKEESDGVIIPLYILTEEEYRMISIVAVNADFTDDNSLLCVIRTIYNRVMSDKFPDTAEEVLRAPRQFESCTKIAGYVPKEAYDYESIKVLIDKVFTEGYDPFEGECCLYYAATWVKPSKIAKGLTLVCVEGESAFYKQN